jgi:hypothetical protein
MKYIYRGIVYTDVSSVDEAICDEIGGNYNNIDPMDTIEFEEEWRDVEIEDDEDVASQIVKSYIRNCGGK